MSVSKDNICHLEVHLHSFTYKEDNLVFKKINKYLAHIRYFIKWQSETKCKQYLEAALAQW